MGLTVNRVIIQRIHTHTHKQIVDIYKDECLKISASIFTHIISPIYYIQHTLPFKFIYYKDEQAHQRRRHKHDDCGATVATLTAVHKGSFEGERAKKTLSAHASQMRTNAHFHTLYEYKLYNCPISFKGASLLACFFC